MKLKTTLTAIAGALLIAGSAYARQDIECPSLSAIKAEGISMAEEVGASIYFTYNLSDYGTDSNWGFLLAPIQESSKDDAIEMANIILNSMIAEGVPVEGVDACQYETGDPDIIAVAVKDPNSMKLKNFYYSMR